MILCNLLIVVLCLPAVSTFAATQQVYEYDASGRLTTMYTADQKTTYSYDKNGNLIGKHQVVQGDSTTPEPTTDPTLIPPPVPVPTKSGLPTQYWVDQVEQTTAYSTCEGIRVSGWYLNPAGIKKIEIYVDGVFRGRAYMGDNREDVYNAYPAYNNHISGFHADDLECTTHEFQREDGTKGIKTGKFEQQVEIRMINRANQVTTYTRMISVTVLTKGDQLPTKYKIDQVEQTTASSSCEGIRVSGWYLNSAGIKKIEIYVDGKFRGLAWLDYSREDVYKAYPAYNNHMSGFQAENMRCTTNEFKREDGTTGIQAGKFEQQVEIRMINQVNQVTSYTRIIPVTVVEKKENQLPIKYWIDQLKQSSGSSANGNLQVSGWYLDQVGIKRVDIYVDGKFQASSSIGDRREDVYNKYPAYDNQTSGFHADNIPITTVGHPRLETNSDGSKEVVPGIFDHLAEVRMVNQDNQVTTSYRTFVINLNK